MHERAHTPIVAIVGRPNVGKSTLFNRYAGHRRALVADSPGLTRDRIVEEIEVAGRHILLVDTAGLDPDAESGLARAVQAQAESAIRDADAVLFVVDGKAGLLPEDESIARTLRRTDKPLVLAVNKIDRVTHHQGRVLEFHGLGFEHVHGVSGEHGTGAFEALEALVGALPGREPEDEEGKDERLRITIVGRPNVGKSSLTNRLLGEERVVVSEDAGTTRDAIDVAFEHAGRALVLVDTAGLRRPGRRRGTGELIGALMTVRSLERAEVALLVVDASEGLTDQDDDVRLKSAWALGQIGDSSAVNAIRGALRTEKSDRARKAQIRALLRSGGRSEAMLTDLLKSSDPEVREAAVRGLAGSNSFNPWPWPWPRPRPTP